MNGKSKIRVVGSFELVAKVDSESLGLVLNEPQE